MSRCRGEVWDDLTRLVGIHCLVIDTHAYYLVGELAGLQVIVELIGEEDGGRMHSEELRVQSLHGLQSGPGDVGDESLLGPSADGESFGPKDKLAAVLALEPLMHLVVEELNAESRLLSHVSEIGEQSSHSVVSGRLSSLSMDHFTSLHFTSLHFTADRT